MAKFTLADLVPDLGKKTAIGVMGPGKSGKTRALSTLLPYGPMALFDWDNGCDPLIRVAKEMGFKDDYVTVYRYLPQGGDKIGPGPRRPTLQGCQMFEDFMSDVNRYYDNLDPRTNKWKEGLPQSQTPFSMIVDSMSPYQDAVLDFVLQKVGHELGASGTHGGADYDLQMKKIVETIECFKGLPVVSVFNFHEQSKTDAVSGQLSVEPLVTGKLSGKISTMFGVVVYTRPGRQWLTEPQGFVRTAGSRFVDNLPPLIPQDFGYLLGLKALPPVAKP